MAALLKVWDLAHEAVPAIKDKTVTNHCPAKLIGTLVQRKKKFSTSHPILAITI
jgi:hypothetical protein